MTATAPPRPKLTPKQQAFVEAYLSNGRNAAAAYRAAYDTEASTERAAHEAHHLLRNPKIAPIVAEADAATQSAVGQAVDRYAMTKADIARRLAILAAGDLRDALTWKDGKVTLKPSEELTDEAAYAIGEIAEAEGGRLRIKAADRRQALMDLARLQGFIPEPERRVRLIRQLGDLTDEEVAALASEAERGGGSGT